MRIRSRTDLVSRVQLFAVLLALGMTTCLLPSRGIALQPDAEVRELARTWLTGCLENARALRKGDLLVRLVDTVDSTEIVARDETGEIERNEVWHRVIFDHDRELFLHVKSAEYSRLLVPPQAPDGSVAGVQEQLSHHVRALALSDGRFGVLYDANGPALIREIENDDQRLKLIREADPVDPRMSCIAWIRSESMYSNAETMERGVILACSLAEKVSVERRMGRNLVVTIEMRADEQFPLDRINTYHIDQEKIVCTWSRTIVRRGEKKGPLKEIRTEWTEMNGLPVVSRSVAENYVSINTKNKRVSAPCKWVADVHWFSVNQELDESLFEPERLNDLKSLLRMVDPQAAGATSLMDQPESPGHSGDQ